MWFVQLFYIDLYMYSISEAIMKYTNQIFFNDVFTAFHNIRNNYYTFAQMKKKSGHFHVYNIPAYIVRIDISNIFLHILLFPMLSILYATEYTAVYIIKLLSRAAS